MLGVSSLPLIISFHGTVSAPQIGLALDVVRGSSCDVGQKQADSRSTNYGENRKRTKFKWVFDIILFRICCNNYFLLRDCINIIAVLDIDHFLENRVT